MARCQSWRLNAEPCIPIHEPGTCELCWSPCRNRIEHADNTGKRCSACWEELTKAAFDTPEIALAILAEDVVPDTVLYALANAPSVDLSVALRAQDRLQQQTDR